MLDPRSVPHPANGRFDERTCTGRRPDAGNRLDA